MSNQPLKLLIATGVVAVLVASVMSRSVEGKFVSPAPGNSDLRRSGLATPAQGVKRSWFSGWFDGMSFKTGSSRANTRPRPLVAKPAVANRLWRDHHRFGP